MATFADMTTYMSKRLIDPSNTAVSADDVKQEINNSISYWKFRRFWFNEVTDTTTLTAQDPEIPFSGVMLVPSMQDDGFCIEYGDARYPLQKVNTPQYDANYLPNGYGLPRWYARNSTDGYQCYPVPDQDYTLRRHYLKDYEDLEEDADTNDFTVYAFRLIELWGLANLIAELRQDIPNMSEYYRTAANDEYRQLCVMNNKANSAGKLTIYSALTTTNY